MCPLAGETVLRDGVEWQLLKLGGGGRIVGVEGGVRGVLFRYCKKKKKKKEAIINQSLVCQAFSLVTFLV